MVYSVITPVTFQNILGFPNPTLPANYGYFLYNNNGTLVWGESVPWTPQYISAASLYVWYDFGDPTTYSSGNWTDKSGNGRGTAGSGAMSVQTGVINGFGAAKFVRSNYSNIATPTSIMPSSGTSFLLCTMWYLDGTQSNTTPVLFYGNLGSSAPFLEVNCTGSTYVASVGGSSQSSGTNYAGQSIWVIYSLVYNSSTGTSLYENGKAVFTNANTGSSWTNTSTGTIGNLSNANPTGNSGNNATGGFCTQFLICSDITQQQKCEGYLAWRYGTQSYLPNTHPYFSSAPTELIN